MTETELQTVRSISGEALHHESAHLHVSGEAVYTDDIPLPANALHAALGLARPAHARIRKLDLEKVKTAPGVVAVAPATTPGAVFTFSRSSFLMRACAGRARPSAACSALAGSGMSSV